MNQSHQNWLTYLPKQACDKLSVFSAVVPSHNENKTPCLKQLENYPVCLLGHFGHIYEALTFQAAAAASTPTCLKRNICDAFLTIAGAASQHSQGFSLAVVWLTRVLAQWRKKHDCS